MINIFNKKEKFDEIKIHEDFVDTTWISLSNKIVDELLKINNYLDRKDTMVDIYEVIISRREVMNNCRKNNTLDLNSEEYKMRKLLCSKSSIVYWEGKCFDKIPPEPTSIPMKYLISILCDWTASAIGKDELEISSYYNRKHKDDFRLSNYTKEVIEELLPIFDNYLKNFY